MLGGELYRPDDPEIQSATAEFQALLEVYNATTHAQRGDRPALLREMFAAVGERVEVRPRLACEYGHVRIGAGTFVNVGCVLLDCAQVTIGRDCQLAPNVQLSTATHPLEAAARRSGWESAHAIVLEDDVWLGAGVIVGPGVRIGARTVVGAGSVVLRSLPAGVFAVGTPARAVRELGPQDEVELPATS